MSKRGRPPIDIGKRFWLAVQKGDPDDCWLWTKSTAGGRIKYGRILYEGRVQNAHRVSWILYNGPIPEGLEVCHSCDNGLCVNPAHLWLGTHKDNQQDMVRKDRNRGAHSNGRLPQKLSTEDVEEIRSMLNRNVPQRAIAIQFGVAQPLISGIKNGRYWNATTYARIAARRNAP